MSDYNTAINFVLKQEDRTLSGHVSTLRGDNGGATRFGIASKYHPELIEQGFFDESKIDRLTALRIAKETYLSEYAKPLGVLKIQDQRLSTAVLSFGVNAPKPKAIETLQYSCGAVCDGIVGPSTLSKVNNGNAVEIFERFSTQCIAYYEHLAQKNEHDRPFLTGWKNRVYEWAKVV